MKSALCWLGVLCACGGSRGQPDAAGGLPPGEGDAGVDVTDATMPSPVSVTVYDSSHAPAAGMSVIFLDGADTPLSITTTDANGLASAVVPAGSSVTAQAPMPPNNSAVALYTFLDVKPGDALIVGSPPDAPTYASVSIDLPPLQGATYYNVASSCGPLATADATTVTLSVTCAQPDVYVRARYNAQTVGWIFKPGVDIATGHLDLTGETYQPLTAVAVTLDNMPVDDFSNQIESWTVVNGIGYDYSLSAGSPDHASHQTAQLFLPAIPEGKLGTRIARRSSAGASNDQYEQVPFSTTYAFDLAQHATPWMTDVAAAGNAITWTETGTGTIDVSVVQLYVYGSPTYHWMVAGPYSPGTMRVPTLPDPFSDANLGPHPIVSVGTVACLARVPGGWDRVRATAVVSDQLRRTIIGSAEGAIAYPYDSLPP